MLAEQDRIKRLLNELLNPGFCDVLTPEFRAKVICDWHQKPPSLGTNRTVIPIPKLGEYPSNIWDIFEELKTVFNRVRGVYVHGSYATGHCVESSDLDLTVLLDDPTNPVKLLGLREKVKNVRSLLKCVDPLQHHGPYFLTVKMLKNYLECYLPIAVWAESKRLLGQETVTFNVVESKEHDKAELERSLKYYNKDIDLSTEYLRKRFVCMANMIPAVVYPWKTGKYTTKYEAAKWMVKEYPFTAVWKVELCVRRDTGGYEHIDSLVKHTKDIVNRIKEIG